MGAPNTSNFGALHKVVACGAARVTAAGAGDNSAITGVTIDRLGYGSLTFAIAYKTTLGSSETLTFAAEYQESSDGSNWDTATSLQAATVAETGVKTAEVGEVEFDLDLSLKKRYIRFNFTPNLSASGTDTADVSAVAVLGGAAVRPAA